MRSAGAGASTNMRASARLVEGVDRVQRLGRRDARELDELARVVEAQQCVCEAVRESG